MACELSPNQTIGNYQFYQFEESLRRNVACDGSTYLRPDDAGSMLPWPYALFWLLIHIPTVIIRVVRWEKAQVLSLILASVSVAVSIQSYTSTALLPEKALVWVPVLLILDVGAMIQVFWLLVEEEGFRPLAKALRRKIQAIVHAGRGSSHGDAISPSNGSTGSKYT